MSANKVPVTFLSGHSPWKGLLGIITRADMLKRDMTFCRFFTCNNGQWGRGRDDFDFDCVSITYLIEERSDYKAWWLLGKNGEAVEIKGGVPRIEHIPDAGLTRVERPYGYVSAIKTIAGELYVCGDGRQVYKRTGGSWQSIAGNMLTREAGTGFFDIDGVSSSCLYAVGWHGAIYFYDGKQWLQDDSPTSAHLAAVRTLAPDDVWIAGDKGVVLHGSFNRWQIIQSDELQGNWYSIEAFNGDIYLAANQSLARVEGNSIVPVDVGLNRAISTHRLHAKDGLLWSIGEKDILVFDGTKWQEVVHPDNV